MELRELHVERLPGLPEPFKIDGAPGLNLVLGPNGSGKTSLTRAVLGLLWPDEASNGHLTAIWQHEGARWHARRSGSLAVTWQRDGQVQPAPPPLPHPDQAAGFRLGLLDLLKLTADASDEGLARAIRNQMAGGYDLGRLLGQTSVSGREGLTAASELERADNKVAELRAQRRELQQDEAQLASLHRQLTAAQAAAARVTALRAAEAAVTAQDAADAAAAQLGADYPAVMDRVQEHDTETLERLRTRERTTAEDLAFVSRQLDEAGAKLDAAGLPDGGPESTLLDTARNRLDEARQVAADLARAEARLQAAETDLSTARQHLAPWGEPAAEQAIPPEALRAEAGEVKTLLEAAARRDGLARLLALPVLQPAADAPVVTPDQHAGGRRALLAWLAASGERRVPWLTLLAAAALLALGVLLRPWTDSWLGWAALAAGGVVLIGGAWPYLLRPGTRGAREAFATTTLAEPPAWTGAAVRQHLVALADQEAAAQLARLQARLREDLTTARDREATTAGDVACAERLDAAEWLHRNAAYHAALVARDAARQERDALAAARDEHLLSVGQSLAPWLAPPPDDLAALIAAVDDLRRRRDSHHAALALRTQLDGRRSELDRLASETTAEIAALLARLELPPNPESDAKVRAYVFRLRSYQESRAKTEHLANRARLLREALDQLPPPADQTAGEALAWPAEERAAALAAAEAEAGRAQDLNDTIVAIRTRLEAALVDAALDEALCARDRAREKLAAIRDQVRGRSLRRLLLTRLQQQHRERSEPPVLQRARDLFQAFTHGAYELLVADRDSESFRARDTRTGEGLALAQLSDGTRAQLLLAARLAYVQEAERGAVIPLFFDESLTASDPGRFAAIGRAILALIDREQRQVFYLTCDPADVAAWQQLLAERGQPPTPVTDLPQLRTQAVAASVDRLRPDPRPPLPAPEPTEDPATYAGRLGGVPRLDPHAAVTAAHVFHLLRDDLALLHRLLAAGAETVGQVQQLAPALVAAGTLTPDQRDGLDARVRALAIFCEHWTCGRGRPVPPGQLTAQSGSTSSKLPEIEALLASPAIAGDAARLVEALTAGEVTRLHGTVLTQVVDWLTREGYLDSRPTLDHAEIRARVLRSAADDLAQQRLTLDGLQDLITAWERAAGRDD